GRPAGRPPRAGRGFIPYVLTGSPPLAPNGPERERGQGPAEPDEADPVGRDSITMKIAAAGRKRPRSTVMETLAGVASVSGQNLPARHARLLSRDSVRTSGHLPECDGSSACRW